MSDPIMSRLLELEKRHNLIIDTTHRLFESQGEMIMAVDKKYDLVRTLLTEVLELMKNDIAKENNK